MKTMKLYFLSLGLFAFTLASCASPAELSDYSVKVQGQNKHHSLRYVEKEHLEKSLVHMLSTAAINQTSQINITQEQTNPARWPLPANQPGVYVRYATPKLLKAHNKQKTLWVKELIFTPFHGIFVKDKKENIHLFTMFAPQHYAEFLLHENSPLRKFAPFQNMATHFEKAWQHFKNQQAVQKRN